MILFIFFASMAAFVLGILMFMAAGMADETGQDSPTWPLVLAIGGFVGAVVCVGIWGVQFAHWVRA
jgi:hypothetical protein